jgi:hypothetical protein
VPPFLHHFTRLLLPEKARAHWILLLVLHQLRQREAATVLHRVDSQSGAGAVNLTLMFSLSVSLCYLFGAHIVFSGGVCSRGYQMGAHSILQQPACGGPNRGQEATRLVLSARRYLLHDPCAVGPRDRPKVPAGEQLPLRSSVAIRLRLHLVLSSCSANIDASVVPFATF